MAAITTTMFARLFGAGMQRVAGSIFQKILRLRKIDSALKGESAKNTAIKTAIQDFEIVLGSYRGEFTQQIDHFLRELEKSGILEAITQQALIRKRSDQLLARFESLYRASVVGHPKSSQELYEQLCVSFEITLRELTKDPVLADVLIEATDSIEKRLASIEACLESSIEQNNRSDEVYTEHLIKLARGLQQTYKEIRIETIKSGAKMVGIDQIYIPPQLRNRTTTSEQLRKTVRSFIRYEQSPVNREPMRFRNRQEITSVIASMTFREFQTTFNRAVILGDPGGGKSTLCQKVCYDLTRNFLASVQMATLSDKVPSQSHKLAIRVILRKFEQARIIEPQLSLLEYIVRDCVSISGLEYDVVKNTVRRILDSGQAVLAFDGLDEILDTSRRRDFVELVENFCLQFALNPVLITSRIVGYQDAPLSKDFEEIILSQLSDDEVKEYLKKFLQVVAAKTASDAEGEADRFMEQTHDNASDLRRNPLLLGLMAFLFHAKGDVPSNRPEIYSDCATLMFDKWDKNRGIIPDVPSDFERAELFSEIAAEMFENVELRAGVSKDWLQGRVLDFFYNLYLDRARAIKSSKTITDFLIGRAWVMSEIGDRIFAFTHQTFLEYYFARGLDGRFDTVLEILKELQPKIIRSEWDVVAHLALQLKTQGAIRRQDEALRWLTDKIGKFRTNKYDLALRRFAAKSLEYLNGTEEEFERMITALANIDIHKPHALDKISILSSALTAANHRRRLVEDRVPALLTDLVFSQEKLNDDLIRSLGPRPNGRGSARVGQYIPDHVAQLIRDNARKTVLMKASQNGSYASLALQWYGHYNVGAVYKFGLDVFLNGYLPDTGVHSAAWAALSASDSYSDFFLPAGHSKEAILALLADIGNSSVKVFTSPLGDRRLHSWHVPAEVWVVVLRDLSSNAAVLRGAVILFLLEHPHILSYQAARGSQPMGTRLSKSRVADLKTLLISAIESGSAEFAHLVREISEDVANLAKT